jgi:hypothetical protein
MAEPEIAVAITIAIAVRINPLCDFKAVEQRNLLSAKVRFLGKSARKIEKSSTVTFGHHAFPVSTFNFHHPVIGPHFVISGD